MRRLLVAAAAAAVVVAGTAAAATSVKPYAKPVPGSGWTATPLWSAGDVVPDTDDPSLQYRMVGIPDGLGVYRTDEDVRVLMTHELPQDAESRPRVGRPAQRGAFATELRMNSNADIVSARRAFDSVYQDGTFVGPAAAADNNTRAFSRWCSAFLAGPKEGLDRRIFFANEETQPESPEPDGSRGPTETFSRLGSQSVAIFDRKAYALSRLGHFPRENTLVMRGTGKKTVILVTEDGPRTPDSQLYLYVGRKDLSSEDPLRRNGLDNGSLYAFASNDARDSENQILQGDKVRGDWVKIEGAESLSDVQTEAAADAAGAFAFVRLEDGEFRPRHRRQFWFAATGDQSGVNEADPRANELGRLYRLRFSSRRHPLKGAVLTQKYNADQLAAGQDGPLTPDNVDVTRRFIYINEDGTSGSPAVDGTTGSRDDLDARGRDGSIWRIRLSKAGDPSTFQRIVELVGAAEGGRDGVRTIDENQRRGGVWETSGIVDAKRYFGGPSFLFDVQAHSPTTPPIGPNVTVEDGQLMLLRRG